MSKRSLETVSLAQEPVKVHKRQAKRRKHNTMEGKTKTTTNARDISLHAKDFDPTKHDDIEIMSATITPENGHVNFRLFIGPEAHQGPALRLLKDSPRFYKSKRAKSYTEKIRNALVSSLGTIAYGSTVAKLRDLISVDALIEVDEVCFVFPFLKKHKNTKSSQTMYKPSKPDLDNLLKSFLDALESVLFKNDAQIVKINSVSKVYGEKGEIVAKIRWKTTFQ